MPEVKTQERGQGHHLQASGRGVEWGGVFEMKQDFQLSRIEIGKEICEHFFSQKLLFLNFILEAS